MSISMAQSRLASARRALETSRRKQADEEKKAAGFDKDASSKERSAKATSSPSMKAQHLKDAARKREDAAAARGRAARYSEEAARAQKKVHDAEEDLHREEQRDAKRQTDQRAAAERKATQDRARTDRDRDRTHQREVSALQARIDRQDALLASTPWANVPEQIVVLFIASSPEDQDGLRIDREMRAIQQKVRAADHRDAICFEYAVAAQPQDLLQRLNEVKPDVVHFSGHGSTAGLALEDSDGRTRLLSPRDLATLVSVSSQRIRLAVFNACDSAEHAAAAAEHLEVAIGMEQAIGDDAAQEFASQLYSAIAFGLPIDRAFAQALLQVRLVLGYESGEPQLHTAAGVDASAVVLVRPNEDVGPE